MTSNFHDVKVAAEQAVLQRYGLDKLADTALALRQNTPLTWGARLRSGGAGGLVGGALGAAHGFITGGGPKEDGSDLTLKDRLRAAAHEGLQSAGIGAALGTIGATAGEYGLNREGLKRMFSATPGRGTFGEMGQYGLFGAPVTAYNRYKEDLARHGGSHLRAIGAQYRRAYIPEARSPWAKGVQYAFNVLPVAATAYNAAKTDDPDERNRMLARTAAGLITTPLTGNLGLPGVYLQQQVSNLAERAVAKKPVPPQASYSPSTHAQVALRGARMNSPTTNFGEAEAS